MIENTSDPNKILFIEMKDSFEKAFILPIDLIIGNLITNKAIETKIIVPINASK
tara:strand:- start:168 stop:329 length:162 start_codon:yes stop_codon:yes gene_type:complete